MATININDLEYKLQNAGFPAEIVASVQDIPGIHDRFLVDRDEAAKFLYFKGVEQTDRALVSEFKRASTITQNFPDVELQISGKASQVDNFEMQINPHGVQANLPLASVLSDEYKVCASNIGAPFPDQFSFFRSDDFQACVQHCRENASHLLGQCSCLDIYTKDGEWVGGYRAGPNGITECMQRPGGRFEQTAVIPFNKEISNISQDNVQVAAKDAKNIDTDVDR